MSRSRLLLAVLVLVAVPLAAAQPVGPAVEWERVGSPPYKGDDLGGRYEVRSNPGLAADGFLYAATFIRYPSGVGFEVVSRLAPPYDAAGLRETVNDDLDPDLVVPLGGDTLVAARSGEWHRSLDAGVTFSPETTGPSWRGTRSGFAEISVGPHAGTLVATGQGTATDFAGYSRDRGATWQLAPNPFPGDFSGDPIDLVVVENGSRAGRVVMACNHWGVAVSDDGGATYQITGLWGQFAVQAAGIVRLTGAAPGGGDRLVVITNEGGPAFGTYHSDDGGETWTPSAALPIESANDKRAVETIDLGGGRAIALSNFGRLFETTDAGETWYRREGVLPYSIWDGSPYNPLVYSLMLGPDGRLYVSGSRIGPERAFDSGSTRPETWLWRTVEPYAVAVASEDGAGSSFLGVVVRPNPSAGGAVTVEVSVAEAAEVRAVVLDARGRRVAEVLAGPVSGTRVVELDTVGWAAGVYAVVVEAGGERRVEAFTVVR